MSLRPLPLLLLAGAMVLWGGAESIDRAWAQDASAPAPVGDDEVTINTDLGGAQQLARQALKKGRPDLAASVARQILAVVPKDVAAHMLLAAALTRMGQPAAAVPVAKAGFRLATAPEAKFEGAYLTAEALAADGRPTAAKLWLRKADRYAPGEQGKAVLRKAYGTVSAQTPLSFAVQLFAGPSDNVNGGSIHEYFRFGNLAIPITQALPGWEVGGQLTMRYALPKDVVLQASWAHRSVVLGDKALAIDPDAKAKNYAQDDLILGAEKFWGSADERTAFRFGGSIGKRWSGGKHSADVARIDLGFFRSVNQSSGFGLQAGIEALSNPVNARYDSLTWSTGVSWRHSGETLGNLALGLSVKNVDTDLVGLAWRGPSLSLAWAPAQQGEVVGLSFTMSVEMREYWKTPSFDPDLKLGLSATAELKNVDVLGFNPTVTLSAGRTKSDLVVRDTSDIGVNFGLQSSF